eukprot:12282758-Ditylum_brightwellii.AAC.1
MSNANMITPMTSKPESKHINITTSTTDSPFDISSSDTTCYPKNLTKDNNHDNIDPSNSKTDIEISSPSDKDTSKPSSNL